MRGDHKDSERTDRHSSRVASAASPVQKSPNTPTPAAQPVQNSPRTPTPAAQPVQKSPNTPTPAAQPVQNSPNTPTPAAQPVQNSPNTPKKAHFSQFCTSRENFVPHPPPRPPAGRTLYRAQRQTRYKTLPAHPKRPISASFARAGRTLYRTQSQSRYKTPLAQPTHRLTRYKTLPTRTKRPISARFARAGRTLYRTPSQSRYKTLPAQPVQALTRYKTLPAHPKRPISARFTPAGRTLYRRHHQEAEQGELSTAPSNTSDTKLSQRPRSTAVPRKSSPSTPKKGVFRLFRACRANFFAHKQATSHAGRITSRTGDRTGSADEGRMR